MTAHALIDVTCPCCGSRFVEQARLLRAGGEAWCPECMQPFALDAGDETIRKMLEAAHDARRDRKRRLRDLQHSWQPVQVAERRPSASDALRQLDLLLDQLDSLIQRRSA